MVIGLVTYCVITFGVKARSISGAWLREGCQALAAVRGLGAELKYKCSTHQGRRRHLKALAEAGVWVLPLQLTPLAPYSTSSTGQVS